MSISFTEESIKNVKLIDESPYSKGRLEFFKDVTTLLSNQFMGCLIFGKKKEGVGGYFTKSGFIPRIVMPHDIATYDETFIKFNDDEQFAIFVHEASHFLHFIRDNGKYTAPSLQSKGFANYKEGIGFSNNKIIDLEYEAGYRALVNSKLYEMFADDDRTVLESNLTNMTNYLTIENKKDIRKPYLDADGRIDTSKFEDYKKDLENRINVWKATVNKWSEIVDYKIKLQEV